MIIPGFRSYTTQFRLHTQEVTSQLSDSAHFLSLMEHLRSVTCSTTDFQKGDMMMKSPAAEPVVRMFWRVWGQDQVGEESWYFSSGIKISQIVHHFTFFICGHFYTMAKYSKISIRDWSSGVGLGVGAGQSHIKLSFQNCNVKGAYILHTPFLELPRIIKYRVSIGDGLP